MFFFDDNLHVSLLAYQYCYISVCERSHVLNQDDYLDLHVRTYNNTFDVHKYVTISTHQKHIIKLHLDSHQNMYNYILYLSLLAY